MKYNLEEINKQATYCLNCKNKPCKQGCPLNNNIPDFIQKIKEEKYKEAFEILQETTIFQPICGRICPHKKQCEGNCIRGIKGQSVQIGKLEQFIGDYALENIDILKNIKKNDKKIAIVGSGPSGLACAYYLSKNGFNVDIYEKHNKLGGLLRYGIPEFRLDKDILDNWLNKYILNENIRVFTDKKLGQDIELKDLEEKYDLIVLAIGANVSNKMNVEGEDKEFVLGGNEFLENKTVSDFKNKDIVVIGCGNVAMDAARTAKKLGANNVTIVYRRSEKEVPAEEKEVNDAKNEGIKFLFKTNMIKVLDDKIECVKTELVQKEGETRAYPVNIENSNFYINTDYVILAISSTTDKQIVQKLNLELNKWGYIVVNERYQTSNPKIYAIGDLAGGKQTVAFAAKSGIECAKNICS